MFWGVRRFLGWGMPIGWLLASLVAGVATLLEWIPPGKCGHNASPCELTVHLTATAVIASGGYFFFFFLQGNRVLKRYLERASESPERLLQEAGAGSEDLVVTSRTDTRDDVIDAVSGSRRPEPILVVGDAGEGKTALLAAIAKELADRSLLGYLGPPAWRVPVGVSLRPGDAFDFEELARKSFIAQVAHGLDEPQRSDAIWRKVKKSLGVVVLVDGIERVRHISRRVRDEQLGAAMAAARKEKIAVVLSVRTSDVPAVKARAFPLERFETEELCEYLEARLRHGMDQDDSDEDDETGGILARLRQAKSWLSPRERRAARGRDEKERQHTAERARSMATRLERLAAETRFDALRTPFYLDVVATIGLSHELDSLARRGRWALQRGLLEDYVSMVAKRARMPDRASGRMFKALSELAPQMLVDGGELDPRTLRDPERALGRPSMLPTDRRQALASAIDLGLLERASSDDPIMFSDPALTAYFAALRFEEPELEDSNRRFHKPLWKQVLQHAPSEEVMKALSMFAAVQSNRDGVDSIARADSVCRELIRMSATGIDADRDLRLARTAAEIAAAWQLDDLYRDIARAGCRTEAADRLQKLKLFRALGKLDDANGYQTLFEYASAVGAIPREWGDFVLRWAASKHLVIGRHDAYEAIAETVDAKITEAEESGTPESEHDCGVIGWLLPGMRRHDGSGRDEDIEEQLRRLLVLALDEDRFEPTGIQNALARGFKIDALSRREPQVDPVAMDEFLPHARFWHARLCLVHAIAIPCFAGERNVRSIERLDAIAAAHGDGGGHKLVRRAAELCLEGIEASKDGRDGRKSYIWEAEGHATSQASKALTAKTAQLVADVAILMNLIYTKKAEDPSWKSQVAITNIPDCLSTSRKRELFKPCRCNFHLCPFPTSTPEHMVRGEVSQAFCRRQSELARTTEPPPWQQSIKPSRLETFWRNMERNAAKKPLLQWWERMSPTEGGDPVPSAERPLARR